MQIQNNLISYSNYTYRTSSATGADWQSAQTAGESLVSEPTDSVELSDEALENYALLADSSAAADSVTGDVAGDSNSKTTRVSLWSDPAGLAHFLGLGGGVQDQNGLIDMLRIVVKQKTTDLESKLKSLLNDNGIALDDNEQITLQFDEEGKIKVTGLEDKDRANQIADVLNADETFATDLKTVRMYRNVYEYELSQQGDGKKSDILDSYRRAAMQNFLAAEGIDLSKITIENGQIRSSDAAQDQVLQQVLTGNDAITEELTQVVQTPPPESPEDITFTFQNGALVDQQYESDKALREAIRSLGESPTIDHPLANSLLGSDVTGDPGALHKYNESVGYAPGKRIVGFDFEMTPNGKFEINGNFADGDKLDSQATGMIQSWFSEEFVNTLESLTDSMLKNHQGKQGDVDDYEHNIVFHTSSYTGITADIFSEDADQAILAQIDQQNEDIAGTIDSYLAQSSPLSSPVDVKITKSGRLALANPLDESSDAKRVKSVLSSLNTAVRQDNISLLPDALKPAFEPLQTIQSLLGRIHNNANRKSAFIIGKQD